MDRKQLVSFSEIASFLRVPLMVLVVCIHGVGSDIQTIDFVNHLPILSIENVYTYITELLSHSLARIAVPLFFFISGYYTFSSKDWTKGDIITGEWKKKIKSLLIPYIVWNSLYLLLLLLKTKIGEYLHLNFNDAFSISSWQELLGYYSFNVVDYPLWYMRELILLTLLSPAIYFSLQKFAKGYILLVFLGFFMGLSLFPGLLGFLSLFFFSIGGYLGYKRINPLESIWRYRSLILISSVILVLALPFLNQFEGYQYLEYIYILLGSCSAFILSNRVIIMFPIQCSRIKEASKYVFFVYAVHTVFLVNWARGLIFRIPLLRPDAIGGILGYLLIILLTIIFSLVCYYILNKIAPRFVRWLSGGRA